MSRLCLFTFNPHPSDTKQFNQIMYNLLHPFTQKLSQYILVREKQGTPSEHIHFIWFKDNVKDTSKIKQFIENKSIKSFISTQIKISNTEYCHAFDYRLIEFSTEAHMEKIGYVLKETECKPIMKGFTHEYIQECVEYYYATEKSNASKIENNWKHLKPNELHSYMEHYAIDLNMSIADPKLIPEMKSRKVSFNQITMKQLNTTKDELVLANKDKVTDDQYNLSYKATMNDTEDNHFWRAQMWMLLEAITEEVDEAEDEQELRSKIQNLYFLYKTKLGGL